ncbi:MAG: DNA polymerase III subunit delta', partial [Magnetovibrio sp.]|nr:DNA polymerase III subunit delta' [Magnetovibrio sp.]
TENVVDDVMRTQGFFALTAGEGGWRVIVVDAADEMNPNAANALLKVLEEPPDRALIVLVCHNPGRLLPTIRSRCQKLRLEPLATDAVAALAARYLPELAPDEARVIAGLAGGSVGRALDLAGSDGLAVYGRVMELLDGLPALDVAALHEFAQSCGGAKGQGTFETAADLIRWTLARLVRYVGEAGAGSGRIDAREQALFQRIGPAAGLESWLQVWEKIDDLLDRANRANLDRKQVILNAFSTLQGAVRS